MPAGVTAGSRSTQSVIGHRKCRGAFSSSSHSGRRTGSGQCDADELPEELDGDRTTVGGLVTFGVCNRGAAGRGRGLGIDSSSSSSTATSTNAPPNLLSLARSESAVVCRRALDAIASRVSISPGDLGGLLRVPSGKGSVQSPPGTSRPSTSDSNAKSREINDRVSSSLDRWKSSFSSSSKARSRRLAKTAYDSRASDHRGDPRCRLVTYHARYDTRNRGRQTAPATKQAPSKYAAANRVASPADDGGRRLSQT
mmetsp:Transcript_1251/g.5050  ORF Transcript_1251/g.5050 Transcript_1251/m.5050 type:complete len:254 (+) Transcript_1251:1747-2508(+)